MKVDSIQRDLGKLEGQADRSHIKFSKDKCSRISGKEESLAVIQAGN